MRKAHPDFAHRGFKVASCFVGVLMLPLLAVASLFGAQFPTLAWIGAPLVFVYSHSSLMGKTPPANAALQAIANVVIAYVQRPRI